MKKRPNFIVNRSTIEAPAAPPNSAEDFGFASELSAVTGLNHLRVAHLRIPPKTRGYPPLAIQDDEIFAFILEGAPDLWADGFLHGLREGDGVAFHAGTGLAHTLINNTKKDVRVFVIAEAFRRNMRAVHAVDAHANEDLRKTGMLWADAPKHKLGPNGGKPGDTKGRKTGNPDYVVHWRKILAKKANQYPASTEPQGINARFGREARFSRIGIHAELVKPGRRTSYPHAERDEEEFVYIVSGKVDCWIDGHIHPMAEGDFVGFKAGTGITHTIINNSGTDALLMVGGEANRMRNQFWYPFHPSSNKSVGELYWADHPRPKLGPHDGMPDALRAKLPKSVLRDRVKANEAARIIGFKKKK
jgi:uncharacterized cupin superfamily protein